MRILRYSADQIYLRPKIVERLRFLTNGGWGRHPAGSALEWELIIKRRGTYFLVWEKGQIVAWALMVPNVKNLYSNRNYKISCYVAASYRRRGIAETLMKKAKNLAKIRHKVLLAAPWSKQGHALFDKLQIKKLTYW